MRPNLLILTLDSFRADRTSLLGYNRPTTPNLDRLAERAIVCTKTRALSCWTQPSLLTAFTSSRPFDHGGFDRGATGRPWTLFNVLSRAGYETTAISTTPWVTPYFGYGFNREEFHFGLNALLGCYCAPLASYLGQTQALEYVGAMWRQMVPALEDFIEGGWDKIYRPADVLKVIWKHEGELFSDPASYVSRWLDPPPKSHDWLGHAWRWKRPLSWLASEGALRLGDRLTGIFDPRLASMRAYRHKRFIDGADLADRVIASIGTAQEPWCVWAHFHDTHMPYLAGRGPKWYRQTSEYLSRLGYSGVDVSTAVKPRPSTLKEREDWSALYDAAMLYTDEQVGRVLSALKEMGLAENTVVAIAGDHGEELGEHGDHGHHFRLYEHNVRVPMLFHAPFHKGRIVADGLTTLLDFAPTIAELCGVEEPKGWQGRHVLSLEVKARDHVLLETVYGGACDLSFRPPYFAVCTKKFKYLWAETLDPNDGLSPKSDELYRIRADPGETINLDGTEPTGWFRGIIRARLEAIEPGLGKARIDAALAEEKT